LAKHNVGVEILDGEYMELFKIEHSEAHRICYSISEMHAALNVGPIFFDYPFTYKGKPAVVYDSDRASITLVIEGDERFINLDRIGVDAKLKQNPEAFTDR